MKTVDFSETIAASDLKGSRSRHLIRRYVSIEGQGHFLSLAKVVYRVSKKNDATFNQYLFSYYNLNWYAFNIYY